MRLLVAIFSSNQLGQFSIFALMNPNSTNSKTSYPSMKRRWTFLGIALILIFTIRFFIATFVPPSPWHHQSWQSLYTRVNLTIEGDTLEVAQIIRDLDVFFTSYTETYPSRSTLSERLFKAHSGDTLTVDSTSWALLQFGAKAYAESQGVIHPGIGGLIQLWGLEYGQNPRVPDSSEIQREMKKMQSLFYRVLDDHKSVVVLRDSCQLALGAFSKGFALEIARQKLLAAGFHNFLLEIGGDLVYNGTNSRGKEWSIGLTDPRHKSKIFRILRLPSQFNALATSGGYENFFIDSAGVKHHHLLDPRTGQSSEGVLSATVLTRGGHIADYLASYLFIDAQSAKEFDDKRKDVEIVVLYDDPDPEQDRLYLSIELKDRIFKTDQFLP